MDVFGTERNEAAVHRILDRPPTTTTETEGGIIENFRFAGGLPGRTYVIRVGYLKNEEGQLTYLPHDLNADQDDPGLAEVISVNHLRLQPGVGGGGDFGGRQTDNRPDRPRRPELEE